MVTTKGVDTSPALPVVGRVLVIDDHPAARQSMVEVLRCAGHQVSACSSAVEALRLIERETFDCILTDLKMPGMSGLELILQLEKRGYPAPVVMITGHATIQTAVEAMRHGAFDYIEKPFSADQLERLVEAAIRQKRTLGGETTGPPGVAAPQLVGSSPAMQAVRRQIAQIARTSETVLICGETGTGKEVVAREIHTQSPRRRGPFVSVNCPALSASLMESELFGHEKGAFTGADSQRIGRFELANGGSLLLDEVTEIDLGLQAKLLRVLQERTFERVGSSRSITVDVRVLATTNRNLEEEIAAGRFRQDLYYRLAVMVLWIPPLRERKEDIPELAEHFRMRVSQRLGREVPPLASEVVALFMEHDWPGNVRELENVITRLGVLSDSGPVPVEQIRRWLIPSPKLSGSELPAGIPVGMSLEEMERRLIEATLEHYGGHRAKTAKVLGIGVRTLTDKLRRYGYAPREKSFHRAGAEKRLIGS
ncbi:MAG: sigma-54 dependent transcriptional regulator [Thermoguttaceae bacterium]|nr:sigma-54 dependent transcriptional regulator [Thermoguttaceae bacterium]MDW8077446.1 sigma-54 dependent transcriptional regulator [Thermoguttaceae bacterium]